MASSLVSDRILTCPECHADNQLVGSDLPGSSQLFCSNCRSPMGPTSDMRDSFVESRPAIRLAVSSWTDRKPGTAE